ncbi:MAG: hypothetical protein R3346_00250 [Candidatus Spechtbacterales bacterium]|nr:hypothetical protein [Candidatus Spechtbacterales bacterium]
MNEFIAKKLGEVLAFERMQEDTLTKGKAAVDRAYGPKEVKAMLIDAKSLKEGIESIAEESEEWGDTVLKKAEKTGKKIADMRNVYLSEDDWDDPVEILEWSGAFEGGALVHWSLVAGGAEAVGLKEASTLAEKGLEAHSSILNRIKEIIRKAETL